MSGTFRCEQCGKIKPVSDLRPYIVEVRTGRSKTQLYHNVDGISRPSGHAETAVYSDRVVRRCLSCARRDLLKLILYVVGLCTLAVVIWSAWSSGFTKHSGGQETAREGESAIEADEPFATTEQDQEPTFGVPEHTTALEQTEGGEEPDPRTILHPFVPAAEGETNPAPSDKITPEREPPDDETVSE